ncbi:MAG: hypothetical protein IJ493_03415 [Clostridia bacterium]|nr:hypothetical protein [Clostridia bacterium]
MLKKTKFYVGITMLIQSASFMAMFIMLCRKKKSLSKAILAVALAGGITGACLLYLDAKDELKRRKIIAARDACCGEHDWISDEDYELHEEPASDEE